MTLVAGLLLAAFGWPASAAQVLDPEPMLSLHNDVRAEVGVPPLAWSETLAEDAAAWADHLAQENACRMRHAPVEDQGENLYWGSPLYWSSGHREVQSVTVEQVVESWASEKADYDDETNTCRGEQCGHYTQMVWKSTDKLGCAKRICDNKEQIWVCRYRPPGNWVGRRPY